MRGGGSCGRGRSRPAAPHQHSPPRHGVADKDGSEARPEKRRLEGDGKMPEGRQNTNVFPNGRPSKPDLPRDPSSAASKPAPKDCNDDESRASSKPKKTEAAAERLSRGVLGVDGIGYRRDVLDLRTAGSSCLSGIVRSSSDKQKLIGFFFLFFSK